MDKFCIVPFITLTTQNKGQIRNCCKSTTKLEEHKKYTPGLSKDTFWNVWNNDYIRQVRLDLINGNFIPACKRCYEEEAANGRSKRISENEVYPIENYKHIIDDCIANDGTVNSFPSCFDLHFGNLCNLKCRTCWIGASNQLANDIFKLVEQNKKLTDYLQMEYNGYDKVKFEWIQHNDEIINLMLEHYKNIEHIEISGGEPSILKEFYVILHAMVKNDQAKNITLRINHNLVQTKKEFLELLPKFKHVSLLGSLDSIGEQNEYLRYPSKWKIIKKHALYIHEYFLNVDNVDFSFNTAVSNQNIAYIPELIDWCLEHNLTLHLDPVHEPPYFKSRIMPLELKNKITEKLTDYSKSIVNDRIKKRLIQMVEMMNVSDELDNKLLVDFYQYMNQLDNLRNQKFTDVFPIWKNYFKEQYEII